MRTTALIRLLTAAVALWLVLDGAVETARAQLFGRRLLRRRGERCRRPSTGTTRAPAQSAWTPLFDGKTLGNWKSTSFGGEGKVKVENGTIQMDFGYSLSGITYQGKTPKTNYEIRLEAMKVDGIDFFCGLTFPVAESHCSFIVGGWAGGIVGLSSLNGLDASENETTKYMTFQKKRWYKIRLRVTKGNISAWIDEKKVVDQEITNRTISIRPEVDPSKPLGIAAWETKSALRKIEIRRLTEAEVQAAR